MINANVLFKKGCDKHLNVFWQYDGRPWLENNITKAFINTFESLDDDSKRHFFREIFDIMLPESKLDFRYYLQTAPSNDIINAVQDNQKLLFAFSPTGKSWGYPGIDAKDTDKIRKSIQTAILERFSNESNEEIQKRIEEQYSETIEKIIGRGDSIPDGWIVAFSGASPVFCVAMENKLYNLDPFQLRNHCDKSLQVKEKAIRYCKYSVILEELSMLKGYLVDDFLRYMYYLNYWEITNLEQLSDSTDDCIEKYAQQRCKQLLKEVSGKDVTMHRGWMYKYDAENPYNSEVGLEYNKFDKTFNMPLYFGATQSRARNMYKQLEGKIWHSTPNFSYRNSFHFQYVGIGKNVECTYYDYDGPIEKVINFWSQHSDDIHQMGKEERHEILTEMYDCGIILKSEYERLIDFSDKYDKQLNICPEIGVLYTWSFGVAVKLDTKHQLSKDIKEKILSAYALFE